MQQFLFRPPGDLPPGQGRRVKSNDLADWICDQVSCFPVEAEEPEETLVGVYHVTTLAPCSTQGEAQWSDWSECSRSCGGGMQSRELGEEMEERDCNTQPCPQGRDRGTDSNVGC